MSYNALKLAYLWLNYWLMHVDYTVQKLSVYHQTKFPPSRSELLLIECSPFGLGILPHFSRNSPRSESTSPQDSLGGVGYVRGALF